MSELEDLKKRVELLEQLLTLKGLQPSADLYPDEHVRFLLANSITQEPWREVWGSYKSRIARGLYVTDVGDSIDVVRGALKADPHTGERFPIKDGDLISRDYGVLFFVDEETGKLTHTDRSHEMITRHNDGYTIRATNGVGTKTGTSDYEKRDVAKFTWSPQELAGSWRGTGWYMGFRNDVKGRNVLYNIKLSRPSEMNDNQFCLVVDAENPNPD